MNGVNALLGGIEQGQTVRKNQIAQQGQQQLSQQFAAGDMSNALNTAIRTGNTKAATAIQTQMKQMKDAELKAAAQTSYDVGAIAFSSKRIPVDQRPQWAAQQFALKGYPQEKIDALLSKMTSWDDATMDAIGASSMDVEKQLAQMTVGTENVNDSIISTRTDNFSGQADVKNALNVDPTFADVETKRSNIAGEDITRDKNESDAASERYKNQTARITAKQGGKTTPGKTPIYGQRDGRRTVFFPDGRGGVTEAPIPDGVEIEGDFFKARQKALGTGRAKLELGRTKAGIKLETALINRDNLREDIDRAILQSKGSNTGNIQGRVTLSNSARNFDETIESIKARIGFAELQDMRDSSPTGGALGQVTEREIAFLQALKGSISRLQDDEQLDQNLARIKRDIDASFERIERAYQSDYENGLFDVDGVNRQPRQSSGNVPAGAIDYLKANPDQAAAFDAKYGAGSSQRFLNNG